MSAYQVNYFLHSLARHREVRDSVSRDAASTLERFDLTPEERTLILAGEVGRLYALGADGFLLHNLQRLTPLVADLETYSERMRSVPLRPMETATESVSTLGD